MKPDYDKLGEEYQASSSVNIVDVDCTKEQDLCSKHGVQGYPTIKYWKDGEVNDFNSGRTYDAMKKFVEDELETKCLVSDPSGCTEKETKYITTRQAKGAEANTKEVARLQKMAAGGMKAELKQWLNQRLNILKQL
eukprot:TRINITY_DN9057_c0_g2_i1.p1 TRINITY_DN9057_c0_g2~~TRINITY_DN9057_c0_g2_i1.p1  ORF type:complete len:136 (+),score=54.85 TRINITY_DN9057_c0_g2_i1:239-646(+)